MVLVVLQKKTNCEAVRCFDMSCINSKLGLDRVSELLHKICLQAHTNKSEHFPLFQLLSLHLGMRTYIESPTFRVSTKTIKSSII
jgi:hypothetical protein